MTNAPPEPRRARPHLDADVLVVGAGPVGSTAAALLAQQGFSVLVLEKERFPRPKIGESLLPALMPVLDRLGVAPRADTYVYKRGARFVCEASDREQAFEFDHALPGAAAHAWHVDRARFDEQLRDRAPRGRVGMRCAAHVILTTRTTVSLNACWPEMKSGAIGVK